MMGGVYTEHVGGSDAVRALVFRVCKLEHYCGCGYVWQRLVGLCGNRTAKTIIQGISHCADHIIGFHELCITIEGVRS